MSRIGKKPVPLPKGVTATIDGQHVEVKGPKGELSFLATDNVALALDEGAINVRPVDDTGPARAAWGMARTQIANLVKGVTQGFERRLEITGVGYRAALQGKSLQLALGYSHDVVHQIPQGIKIEVPKPTEIVISGINAQQVGQVAADIRKYRPPEPYKGKGIRYAGEKILRKEGKKK